MMAGETAEKKSAENMEANVLPHPTTVLPPLSKLEPALKLRPEKSVLLLKIKKRFIYLRLYAIRKRVSEAEQNFVAKTLSPIVARLGPLLARFTSKKG
ncbi:Uncharacterised protein [uncultured archaeon]|nr:Uncharacterised protein [uncultured archaeon]